MTAGMVDWYALAEEVGTISADHMSNERGGTMYARRALEEILGAENIRSATEFVLDRSYGCELARNVLVHIRSSEALEIAYQAYKTGDEGMIASALLLMKDLCHPKSMHWMGEFLHHDSQTVVSLGLSILEDLIWSRTIRYDDERIKPLLTLASLHCDDRIREKAACLRRHIHLWKHPRRRLYRGRFSAHSRSK